MNDPTEESERFEGDRMIVTDVLCLRFSQPLVILIFILFFVVIFIGYTFSSFHPPDSDGFRCGINNDVYGASGKDFVSLSYVGFNDSGRVCVDSCGGKTFFAVCIPNDIREMKKMPIIFKLIDDFLSYWGYLLLMAIGSLILVIPLFFICAKMASYIFALIILISITLNALAALFCLQNGEYSSFVFFSASCFGLFLVFLIFRRRVSSIAPLISTSIDFIRSSTTVLYSIPCLIVGGICAVVFSIFGIVVSNGVGEPKISKEKMSLERHGSLIWTSILFIVAGQWIYEFIQTLFRVSISRIICHAYFQKKPPTIKESINHILKYHTGTIFLGSFIVYLLDDIAYLLGRLKKLAEKTENKLVKFFTKCILSLLIVVTKIAGSINRLSFVFTALKGVSFWDSCMWSIDAMTDINFASTELVLYESFKFIRYCISGTFAAIAYAVSGKIGLFYPFAFALIAGLVVYFIIGTVECAILSSCESLLVCVREDVHVKGPQNALAPPALWELVGFFSSSTTPQKV